MKYLLCKIPLGKVSEIEITVEEYVEYKKARNILSNALAIEEKYEIVIANYLAFENQILKTTTDYMVRDHIDYSGFFETSLGLNIRLVNLLAAARLYTDQLNRNIRECVPDVSDIGEVVKGFLSNEYDKNKEYRFMEELRNYVQHRGIPVHWAQQGSRWTSLGDDGFLEYYVDVTSQRSFLEEDSKFKKEVLKELDEKIDLKEAARGYVESISNVHESARGLIAESVASARKLIEEAHRRYKAIHTESLVGLCVCEVSNDGQVSATPLLLDWDDIRVRLQSRNRKLMNLRKRYVTSSTKAHDK